MSVIKDCGGHKGCECEKEKVHRRLCWALVALVLLTLFIVLVVWLALRPHKPRFYLQDLSVLCLNVTPPASAYLFTTMQATVAARNDNGRVGVYYDKVDVYAQYKDVAITVPTRLPVEYQGHYDQSVWSPFLQSLDHVVLPPTSPSPSPRTRPPATSSSTSASTAGSDGRSAPGSPATTTSASTAPPSSPSTTARAATASTTAAAMATSASSKQLHAPSMSSCVFFLHFLLLLLFFFLISFTASLLLLA
ncbi:hypothetical protein DAI22_04g316301 [Oryza sativa Japonica Group]|nr:hypothetical protein DAI22_04g316301 [Oryza sativa Japonica Group]